MNKYFVLLNLHLVLLSLCLSAQNIEGYQKLRGSVISTIPENDYTRHAYNAFDTNKGTSFMSRDVSGWVGLDLGEPFSIKKIRIFPMPDRHNQADGTVFQVADNPDFNNPVTIASINGSLASGTFTTYDIQNNQKYRYIRCINTKHRCSVAEIEFYTNQNEQILTYPQLTNLPTIYLETGGKFDFINKKNYAISKVAISKNNQVQVFDAQVRGRGNSTWEFMEKKPFRIKFDKKQNFLGLPAKAKSWTLIALAVDKTLLRNGLAFEMSKILDFEFTPSCVMVDVVLDGFYYGTFMASDHIEVDENRINIDEMSPDDIVAPNITGGYHLEIDAYADQEPVFFKTPRNIPFTIKSPDSDEILPVQKQWIENHIAQTENMLFGDTEAALSQYIDIQSAVKYYIHSELTGNCDAYWCIPCYKKRGDDKLYFGPVWDFDQAFLTNDRVPRYTETLSTQHGVAQSWFRKIMSSASARELLPVLWNEAKDNNLKNHLIDYLLDNAYILQQSQALNFNRWNSIGRKVWFEGALFNTYDEYIDFVEQFIEDRFAWFDEMAQYRKPILPISSPGNPLQEWNYTFDAPSEDWYQPSFNDRYWTRGNAPFGTERNLQNTLWNTNQIYIRTKFDVSSEDITNVSKAYFYAFHDEDVEVYLNGELAMEQTGYLTDYKYYEFDKDLLIPGRNTLAVKCIQSSGGQLIDVGIYVTEEDPISALENQETEQTYTYYVQADVLHLNSLTRGDLIQIYSMDGKLIHNTKAIGPIMNFMLSSKGVYIVKINNENTLKIIF